MITETSVEYGSVNYLAQEKSYLRVKNYNGKL